MSTLNSPSSRVVKDSTPFQRRILRYVNLGISVNLHLFYFWTWWIFTLLYLKHGESWTSVRFIVLLFSLFESESWPRKNKSVCESSPNFIFAVVYLDPIILKKRWIDGESWPNDVAEKVNRGEKLKWVGSDALWRLHKYRLTYVFFLFCFDFVFVFVCLFFVFLVPSTIYYKMHTLFFKKCVDNFEIDQQTF